MARTYARYMSPEDEEALLYGPPAPPNLGVAPVPRIPLTEMDRLAGRAEIPERPLGFRGRDPEYERMKAEGKLVQNVGGMDVTTPRMTDRSYRDFHDPYQDEEPTEEELAADLEHEGAEEQVAPVSGERVEADEGHPLDVFLTDVANAANPFEEEAQSYAVAQKRVAPKAVDPKAASVADELKGVPAPERTDEGLAQPGARTGAVAEWMLEKGPASGRTYGDAADRMVGAPQKGERTDLLGFDDEEGFSRQKLIQRVQELYGEDSEPGRYWEDEFLSRKKPIRDQDVERGWLLQSLWHGQEAGNDFRQMRRREQGDYERGLSEARQQDFGNRRISRAMAEAIAATGQVSPEAAVNLRMNDPIVKNFGQYASQGGRAEGQGVGLSKAKLGIIADLMKSENAEDRMKAIAMLQSATQLDTAQMRAQAISQLTPEQIAALGGTWMASAIGVSKEKGEAVLQGDRTGLTPEQARKADLATPDILAAQSDPKVRGQVLSDRVKSTVNAEQKQENAIAQARALAQNDTKFALKFQSEWRAAEMPLKNAMQSWKAMSPEGKKAFVSFAQQQKEGGILDMTTITDQLAKAFSYAPGDQTHASRVLAAINSYVKSNSGSAVTGSEWDRVAKRVGLATGTWAPFNDPEVVGTFLDDAARAMIEDRKDYERIMNGWK